MVMITTVTAIVTAIVTTIATTTTSDALLEREEYVMIKHSVGNTSYKILVADAMGIFLLFIKYVL